MVKCGAAVLYRMGEPLIIETSSLAPLEANDVLIKVGASSLCHTDLEVIDGQLAYPMPIVLGHETAGVSAEVVAQVG